jgi:hypothetical protein
MPVVPALSQLRQEDWEFKASLGFQKKKKKKEGPGMVVHICKHSHWEA